MKISWFEFINQKIVRVYADLIEMSDHILKFSHKNKNYELNSAYNLKEMLYDDVLFSIRKEDTLYPFRGNPKLSQEIFEYDFPELSEEERRDLWENKHKRLKDKWNRAKQTLQDLISQQARLDSDTFQSFQDGIDFDLRYNIILKGNKELAKIIRKRKSGSLQVSSSVPNAMSSTIMSSPNEQPLTLLEDGDNESDNDNQDDESKIKLNLLDEETREEIQDFFEE
ncbi:hypothetical protein DSAG12_02795 [Promethearchaeum syntrophicum]|uniref:Uncharacterized protein n=1 Tax=Promethearchaeum syntrophicum TaxID=2594042 RepID=A0A5B9DCW2_9ARCH|nr:hypothetical protein [Candidatus Prometheoarchaeum syntrophicum]QEE16964.1 hypothetical protein DSAG12_02795 [Candidatus Prometheoarchaeum syntrophicum]